MHEKVAFVNYFSYLCMTKTKKYGKKDSIYQSGNHPVCTRQ